MKKRDSILLLFVTLGIICFDVMASGTGRFVFS